MNNGAITHTVTALKRWSCQDSQLPAVDRVRQIHIYDFDNTLFSSPLPNKQVWNTGTFGQLQAQDFLHNGGWWHNPRILAATGRGVEEEEARAWEGCWNEKIVELVRMSMTEHETLNVLLTGRSEAAFGELIGRMIAAKGLTFHMLCLKPSVSPSGEVFGNTMLFKQALLRDIVFTYKQAGEIRIYEDRPKHTKAFRDYFDSLNTQLHNSVSTPSLPLPRQPIAAEVIQVEENDSYMDPPTEVAEVQRMINTHNQAIRDGSAPRGASPYKIKRSVFYTGYLISASDTDKLKSLVKLPQNCPEHELRHLANNILITPRPAPHSILNKVGGIGAKVRWKVTGIACHEQRVWAARVQCTSPAVHIYTENHTPCVVLATRRQAKPVEASRIANWQPVPESEAFEFETVVGEKVLLRVEEEVPYEDEYEASFPNAKNARKHPREEDFPPLGSSRPAHESRGSRQNQNGPRPQQRSYNAQANGSPAWGTKGGGGGGIGFSASRGGGNNAGRGAGQRGGGAGQRRGFGGRPENNRGGGRGRAGPRGGYRSLDNSANQGYTAGGMDY